MKLILRKMFGPKKKFGVKVWGPILCLCKICYERKNSKKKHSSPDKISSWWVGELLWALVYNFFYVKPNLLGYNEWWLSSGSDKNISGFC